MKIFCLGFIFYLLLLSWQPCKDLTTKILSSEQNPDVQANHLHDGETTDERDECSPFCICSCGQVSPVYTNLNFSITTVFVASFENIPEIYYRNPYSFRNLNLIWQPPKVDFTV